MQQIIYVPPEGNYEIPDTCVTFALAPPYVIGSVSGTSGTEVSLISNTIPGVDGIYLHGVRTESREISFFIHVDGESRRDMYQKRFELIQKLAPRDTPGMLYYTNDYTTKRIAAIPLRCPDFTERIRNYNKAEISFLCPSPYWESLTEKSGYMAYLDEGFQFPLEFYPTVSFAAIENQVMLINDGSISTPLHITIAGPATNPSVTNETTGEQIRLLQSLTASQVLEIDTKRGQKSVTIIEGSNRQDAFQYLDPQSVFFSLVPGNNLLRYKSDNESEMTQVDLRYRELFAGV